jgi:hypothetical protein
MSRNARRIGTLAATAITAATLVLPLAPTTALADASLTEVSVFIADNDGDGFAGLYKRTSPSATPVTLVGESATTDVSDARTSADGSRIVTVESSYPDVGDGHERIVVRDISGRLVRVVEDIPSTASDFTFFPALSADGNSAVWTRISFPSTGPTVSLRHATVGSAATTVVGGGNLVGAAYLDATTLIASSTATGIAYTIPVTGGSQTAVVGGPVKSLGFTVSPDATRLGWSAYTAADTATADTADIQVAPFTLADGVATIGATTTVATNSNNISPAWARDGLSVSFIKNDGQAGPGDVWTGPADGLTPAVAVANTAADEIRIATGATDAIAPAAATTNPFTVRGTGATLSWALPADADLSGVVITRMLGTAVQKSVYVPAPSTSYADTGLVVGKTYGYSITTVDRSGNLGTPATRNLTALSTVASFAGPTSATSVKAAFPVSFGPGDPSNTLFKVDYRVNGGAFTNWVAGKPGLTRTFGAPSAGAANTTSTPGNNYAFRITATDAYGNSTLPAISGVAVVPYDQTKAVFTAGSVTARASNRYLGSVTGLKTAGATAKLTLVGYRFQVIGERCPTCGIFDVYSGSTRIGSIDTYAKTRQARVVLYTGTWKVSAKRALTIKARGTAKRPWVYLDGFAMAH